MTLWQLGLAAIGAVGLLVGSFANVAIHRWPRRESVVAPRSRCPSCGTEIAARDNVPVLSWLLLRGRCRVCASRISGRYPLVELVTAAVWLAVAGVRGPDWVLLALLPFAWSLVVATWIDAEHRIIPNVLTYRLPLVLLPGLVVAAATSGEWWDLGRAALAALLVPAVMLLLSEAFYRLRGVEGMGMGDVKYAVSVALTIGFLGGWELVVWFYATIVSAVAVALVLVVTGRARLASRIPFGPYMALGAFVVLVAGEQAVGVLERWFLVPPS